MSFVCSVGTMIGGWIQSLGTLRAVKMFVTHFFECGVSGVKHLLRMAQKFYPASPVIAAAFCCAIGVTATSGATAVRKSYDVQGGDAAATLTQFARHSGCQIVYLVENVRGEKTQPVRGEYAAIDALRLMLAGTALFAVQDDSTGALVVSRKRPAPAQKENGESERSRGPPAGAPAPPPDPPKTAQPKHTESPPVKNRNLLSFLAGWLAAGAAVEAQTAAVPSKEEVVTLSPFEVTASNRGYYGSNTMSGTRLNSKLEDLGASITVVTKEQMQDFALLDINDIFSYEVSTEGTGNYTDFSISSSNGQPIDNTQLEPLKANRVRGLGNVNMSMGNFEMSGRKPIDPVEIDAVEISRGPNSSVFGLGNAAGTVNSVPAAANLSRDASTFTARVDSTDGFRTSLDLNRVVLKGRLAVRTSAVFQHDGYNLKPSGTNTRRLNGMIKFKPFKSTEVSAYYSFYQLNGNRPNTTMPRDAISRWKLAGAPTWDPVTFTAKINGQPVGTFSSATPVYFNTNNMNYAQAYIDQNGLSYLGTGRSTTSTNPASGNQNMRLMNAQIDPSGVLLAQPLLADNPTVSTKEIYDWTKVNIASSNRIEEKTEIASALITQVLVDSPQHSLALQLGWLREQTERFTRNAMGAGSGATIANVLQVDVNERMLDGKPNPYFLRPFLGAVIPATLLQPLDRDTFRAQLAYQLNLSQEKSWMRWIGTHQMSAYGEYKNIQSRTTDMRDAIIDNHTWAGSDQIRGQSAGVGSLTAVGNFTIPFQRYYMGDNQGYNIDYGPTASRAGSYVLNWGNGATGAFVQEPVVIGSAAAGSSGGIYNNWTELKSQGATIQSHFWRDRIVTTFGLRKDQRYSRNGAPVAFRDGVNLNYDTYNQWATGDWATGKGKTTTAGFVLKPLPWFNLYLNKSNSFQPADLAYSLHRQVLPDPAGAGKDYGVALSLFSGKLVMRINRYTTTVNNARNGDSSNLAKRLYRLDFSSTTGTATVLQRLATPWVVDAAAAKGITLTQDQINQQVAAIMKLPVEYLIDTKTAFATDDLTSKGMEVEVNYNPNPLWTMKLNVAQQEAINSQLAQELTDWINERLPVWNSIIDPTINRPFFTEHYNNGASPADNLQSTVLAPLKVTQAMAGKSRPQIRKYRVNYSTNFRLASITDNPILKRFNVGGALRWEDKGAIGYWGVQSLPALITDLDPTRPIYDKAHLYADAFLTYRTRMFADKVTTTFQFNVRNIQEGGRLQPIVADPDGSYVAYRIIAPRLFIFSASFAF